MRMKETKTNIADLLLFSTYAALVYQGINVIWCMASQKVITIFILINSSPTWSKRN